MSVTDKDQFHERRFSFYILIIYFGVFGIVLVTLLLMNLWGAWQYKVKFFKVTFLWELKIRQSEDFDPRGMRSRLWGLIKMSQEKLQHPQIGLESIKRGMI